MIYFSWRVVVPSPQIDITISRTYEKLPCKEESDRFSSYRDPLVQIYKQTHRQTDRHPVTLL